MRAICNSNKHRVSELRMTVLAIDPGRCKCGVAVVSNTNEIEVLHRAVVSTEQIPDVLSDLYARYSPDVIIIGNGTTAKVVMESAKKLSSNVELVDEKFTSIEARKKYFIENPPRGLHRLIPISLQTPNQPFDDYVAVILAERYLALL